jgi:pimeloyl-ACP methyl ester carboxylesterase
MPYIDRDGVKVFYRDSGTGPLVVLSHGYGATSSMWKGQAGALSDRYRIVSWDMRGHGQSDSPEDAAQYSEQTTIDDIDALIDHCEAKKAVVGGLSLGGYMSLAFNLAYPDRVHALMLFDTGPGYRNSEARAGWNEMAEGRARDFREKGLDALSSAGREVRASSHTSAEGLAFAALGMLRQYDSRVIESLPTIRVPTLVVVGELDKPFLAATEVMAAKIPNAKKVVIPDAGHAVNLYQPEAFNQAVSDFLAGLDPW